MFNLDVCSKLVRDTPNTLAVHAVEENGIIGGYESDEVEHRAPQRETMAGGIWENLLIEDVKTAGVRGGFAAFVFIHDKGAGRWKGGGGCSGKG